MSRLRQRDSYRYTDGLMTFGLIGGSVYSAQLVSIMPAGEMQAVLDEGIKQPYRRWGNILPPLHSVQMSKCVTPPTKDGDWVNWMYRYPGTSYYFAYKGPNLAYFPLTSGIYSETAIPLGCDLISTESNVNSWILQRAYSKMSSAEFDFGVTLGEVAETAAFLAGPLGKIASLSSAAFRGASALYTQGTKTCVRVAKNASAKHARRLLATTKQHPLDTSLRIVDETANHWLAYKFGVLPLIDDIGKALDFKERNVAQAFGLQCARVKGPKIQTLNQKVTKNSAPLAGGGIAFDLWAVRQSTDQYSCGIYFRNKCNEPLVNFMEKLGFAPWQLPSLAWELIPLSFVVDRFIDVKSFVRGNIGSLSKETYGSWITRKLETVTTANLTRMRIGGTTDSYLVPNLKQQTAVLVKSQMVRILNQPRPSFPVVNPYWRDQMTADMTNLSLIWGRLRTHVGKLIEE